MSDHLEHGREYPGINRYAHNVLTWPAMDPNVLAEYRKAREAAKQFDRSTLRKLLFGSYNTEPRSSHPVRPVARSREAHIREDQPEDLRSDARAERNGGQRQARAVGPDRRLPAISVPHLHTARVTNTMEPAQMEKIAKDVQNGRYLYCTGRQPPSDLRRSESLYGGIECSFCGMWTPALSDP